MNDKSNLLILILFTLTVGAVGWLGTILIGQQDQQLRITQINRLQQSLDLFKNNIENTIHNYNQRFSPFSNYSFEQFDEEIQHNPLLHGITVFDENDTVIYPSSASVLQQRNAHHWLANIAQADEKITKENLLNQGWFSWHDQQKENYIYWINSKSKKYFLELNNSMFMAEFIYFLSQQPPFDDLSFVRILDNQGRSFYQWGDEKFSETAEMQLQSGLNSPLNGWSVQFFSKIPGLTLWSKYLFQIIITAVVILLCLLSYFLYRIIRSEQQEAMQRLSFINQVSHELKTPLTNIRLHGELLERTLEKQNIQNNSGSSLAIIQQESKRLTRLINNVLNFNSLEKNNLQLNSVSIDFDEFLQQAIEPFQPTFQRLNIEIDLQNQIQKEVNIDVDICKQIIGNLLSNIEKYAAESEVVSINAKDLNNEISIIVCDQGQGISSRLAEKIFQPFYRIHNKLTTASGSGLGLGLARDLARLHGGDLQLVSSSKKGACFQLTIKELKSV